MILDCVINKHKYKIPNTDEKSPNTNIDAAGDWVQPRSDMVFTSYRLGRPHLISAPRNTLLMQIQIQKYKYTMTNTQQQIQNNNMVFTSYCLRHPHLISAPRNTVLMQIQIQKYKYTTTNSSYKQTNTNGRPHLISAQYSHSKYVNTNTKVQIQMNKYTTTNAK